MEVEPPTAARASSPRKWPTIMESTVLYICCTKAPSMIGTRKASICFQMTPSVNARGAADVVFKTFCCSMGKLYVAICVKSNHRLHEGMRRH